MMALLASPETVPIIRHMGSDQIRDRYLEALDLVSLADLSRESGRAYRTLTSYRLGERRVTEAAAQELAVYLRSRSESLMAAAAALEAALEKEVEHE